MIFFKKAVSPVVATALLLVVAVSAAVGFSGWFSEFNSNLFVDVESDSSSSSSVRVEGIFNDVLYLKSNSNSNLNLLSIMDSNGVNVCSFADDLRSNLQSETRLLFTFDNNTFNGTHLSDSSGYDNDGVLIGVPTYVSNNCISNECFFYNDFNNTILVKSNSSLDIEGEITLSAWYNSNSLNNHIISKAAWNSSLGWYDAAYSLKAGSPSFNKISFLFGDVNNYLVGDNVSAQNIWHHVVATYDGITGNIYDNGKLISTLDLTENISISSKDLLIGALTRGLGDVYGDYFGGYIDEVVIYSKGISQEQVNILYNSRKALRYEQLLDRGINKIDLSSCNLNSNEKYNVLVGGDNGLIDVEVILQ